MCNCPLNSQPSARDCQAIQANAAAAERAFAASHGPSYAYAQMCKATLAARSILHRFESILSWVESMNLRRSEDDSDDENAQKAADDMDNITLSKVDKRAAARLRPHLDFSLADTDHEKL